MRIIYIANTRLPTEMAHGLQIIKTCEAFTKNGAKVELIVPLRFSTFKFGKKDIFEYYKIEKRFKIRKIFSIDLTPFNRFLGPVSSLIQSLSFSFFTLIYLLFASIFLIKKDDIIYSRDRFGLYFISFFRKNSFFEIHKIHKHLDIGITKRVKKIIAITKGLKKDLIKNKIKDNKILVIGDGIDLKDFNIKESKESCRKRLNLPIKTNLVLYTGHLFKWKGVEKLALASRHLDNTLIIIVGGIKWYLSNFKKFVKKNDLKNIKILGHKPYSEIPFYLTSSDCLILTGTSRSIVSKKYTSPMKMFEYMASKRPIVASNLESFKEILNDKNSILVESDNEKALAGGINIVLNNKDLAENISSQAYLDVQKYSWDNRAKKILDFICVE